MGAPRQQRPGTMGPVLPGFEAKVVDDQDVEVPRGVSGELVVRHHEPFSFSTGYFGMAADTVEAWRNLWFHTGDRVVRADDRYSDHRPNQGRHPPAWREHLVFRRGAGAAEPSGGRDGRGRPGALRACSDDEVMAALCCARGSVSPAELLEYCEPRSPTSPCRATSNSSTSCR